MTTEQSEDRKYDHELAYTKYRQAGRQHAENMITEQAACRKYNHRTGGMQKI